MKRKNLKLVFTMITLIFMQGCSTLDSISASTSDFLETVPQNVKTAAMEKVDQENELYGIGSSTIGDSGVEIATAKAAVDAKKSLRNLVKTEADMNFNSFMLNMDSHTKKIYTPIIPDLVNYTVEIEMEKAVEEGKWVDGKRAYSLVTVKRSSVFEESKKTFRTFTDKLSEKIKNAKNSTETAVMPEKQKTSAGSKTEGTPNLELENNNEFSGEDRSAGE